MLSVSRLRNGTVPPGDALRYGRHTARVPAYMLHVSVDKKPVVVWNMTRLCNLRCIHCYADAGDEPLPDEMTTAEGIRLIDELADFGVPTLLFSGGEPLTRDDLLPLAAHAVEKGIRWVPSTNGTLITPDVAQGIHKAGFSYVGVSLDGMAPLNDKIRGRKGAFDEGVRGARYCREAGTRVGRRFTVHAMNVTDLPPLFALLDEEDIPRLCVYHLAYAGRGQKMQRFSLDPQQTRAVMDHIFQRSDDLHRRGIEKEILSVST